MPEKKSKEQTGNLVLDVKRKDSITVILSDGVRFTITPKTISELKTRLSFRNVPHSVQILRPEILARMENSDASKNA